MSSLAAARADNFYYPPEYKPEHGSLNRFRGSHPLGIRAKKIHQGIIVIRFEMPFKVFCTKCHEVIAKGVRFNAEKKCVGNYISTKIFEFSMKCCFCDNIFRIETDPKNCDYKVTQGLHKKIETFSADDAGTTEFLSAEERQAVDNDPMLKLEVQKHDRVKAQGVHEQLEELLSLQTDRSAEGNYYDMNCKLRKRFRTWKVADIENEKEEKRLKNFAVPMLAPSAGDVSEASSIRFVKSSSRLERRVKDVLAASSRIFNPKPTSSLQLRRPLEKRRICPAEKVVPDPLCSKMSLVLRPPPPKDPEPPAETAEQRRCRLTKEFVRLNTERRHAARIHR